MTAWIKQVVAAWLVATMWLPFRSAGADTNAPLTFQEVYSLVKSNLAGVDESQLDRLALEGLLGQLHGKVTIITNVPVASDLQTNSTAPLLSKSSLVEGAYACLRVRRVEAGLADEFRSAFQQISATNKLNGLVLDLRFAAGKDFAAAMAVADRFVASEKVLLSVGETTMRSTAKEDAIKLPVAVLVNHLTSGAAEALATVLRRNNVALIIGSRTAGDVVLFREFPLSGGQRLRIASGNVRYGDGQTLPAKGVKPDITVEVSPEDERVYWEDPYKVLASVLSPAADDGATNRPARLINEAELVRRHREGTSLEDLTNETAKVEAVAAQPQIRDPALGRAIDLLKGIAVVKQFR